MQSIRLKWGTVGGVFDREEDAHEAVQELRYLGFRDAQIGVVAHPRSRHGTLVENHIPSGPATGFAVGTELGSAWGLGMTAGFFPEIGPAIAGGTLATVLSSATSDGANLDLADALVELGITETNAQYYEDEFASGKTIVLVNAGSRAEVAEVVLTRTHMHR